MKKINLAITGCTGRMGQQLIKSSRKDKNFKLTALKENREIKEKIKGIKHCLNSDSAFKNSSVIIEELLLNIQRIMNSLKLFVTIVAKYLILNLTSFNIKSLCINQQKKKK